MEVRTGHSGVRAVIYEHGKPIQNDDGLESQSATLKSLSEIPSLRPRGERGMTVRERTPCHMILYVRFILYRVCAHARSCELTISYIICTYM